MGRYQVVAVAEAPEIKASKRAIFGWMMFDWAAQPFFTVVISFVFGPYFSSRMTADPVAGFSAWSNTNTIASIIIAVLSPALGAVADATGGRKRWIAFFAVIKILSLLALWNAAPGSSVATVGLLIILAMVSAEFSIVFNDSMLTRLVDKRSVGVVSNIAWGLGYIGGLIALFFVLLFLVGDATTGKTLLGAKPLFGLDPATGEDARITGPLAGIWYLIFVMPMFLFTPDSSTGLPIGTAVTKGLSELRKTLRQIVERKSVLKFLIARMIYQDGVNGLILLGGAFAASMFGWHTLGIGIYGIILIVVAILGNLIASYLDTALGSKTVVVICLVLLIVATIGNISTAPGETLFGLVQLSTTDSGGLVFGLFGTSAEKIYILYGLLIGIAFGPVQASSRSYLARSIDKSEAGRFFGIYALSGRATAFMATGLSSILVWVTGSARVGMGSLILFFVVGLAILFTTPYPADKK
jgi:UMF1 family MFS transporter